MLGLRELQAALEKHDVSDLECLRMLSQGDLEEMGIVGSPQAALLWDAIGVLTLLFMR